MGGRIRVFDGTGFAFHFRAIEDSDPATGPEEDAE